MLKTTSTSNKEDNIRDGHQPVPGGALQRRALLTRRPAAEEANRTPVYNTRKARSQTSLFPTTNDFSKEFKFAQASSYMKLG